MLADTNTFTPSRLFQTNLSVNLEGVPSTISEEEAYLSSWPWSVQVSTEQTGWPGTS